MNLTTISDPQNLAGIFNFEFIGRVIWTNPLHIKYEKNTYTTLLSKVRESGQKLIYLLALPQMTVTLTAIYAMSPTCFLTLLVKICIKT